MPITKTAPVEPILKHTLEWIDPETAAKYLEHNQCNRPKNDRNIAKFTRLMKLDLWNYDGAPVGFDWDGNLKQGQNRLTAVVQSGTTQQFMVIRGLDPEVFDESDTGATLKFNQILHRRGYKDAVGKASVTDLLAKYHRSEGQLPPGNAAGMYDWSNGERLAYFTGHAWIEEDWPIIRKIYRDVRHLPVSVVGVAWGILSQIDREDAEVFFRRLGEAGDHPSDSPILQLRERLAQIENPGGRKNYLLGLVFLVWNKWRDEGEHGCRLLRYKPGGAHPSKFPIPH